MSNNLKHRVSKKIKDLRFAKGYTSYETFAIDFNLDRKQYWRMENGSNITINTLENILNIHQMSPKDFFSDIE